MDAKLFLAQLLAKGHTIPENAHRAIVYTEQVCFYAKEPYDQAVWNGIRASEYIYGADIDFENEQVAYDSYVINFEDEAFTIEEFNAFLAENPLLVEELKFRQQLAVKRLAELASVITEALQEGEVLASELGLPFVVKLGGSLQDVRKLAAVDWDSSSMYC